jgi:ketosteroid isomerase-like protein
MTPEEFLSSFVKEFNAGDINSLLMLYETDACTVSQLGQVVKGHNNIRQSLQGFIDMKGKLKNKVKRVIQTSNLALVISEWSFQGTGDDDGNPVNFIGKSTDVLRQQSDGSWRILIDNPWGTDISTG